MIIKSKHKKALAESKQNFKSIQTILPNIKIFIIFYRMLSIRNHD